MDYHRNARTMLHSRETMARTKAVVEIQISPADGGAVALISGSDGRWALMTLCRMRYATVAHSMTPSEKPARRSGLWADRFSLGT